MFFFLILLFHYFIVFNLELIKKIKNKKNEKKTLKKYKKSKKKKIIVGDIGSPTHPCSMFHVLSIKTWCLKHGKKSLNEPKKGRRCKRRRGVKEKGKALREEIGRSRRGRKSHHDDRCVEEEELGDRERKE